MNSVNGELFSLMHKVSFSKSKYVPYILNFPHRILEDIFSVNTFDFK